MKCSEVMKRDLQCATETDSVHRVATRMRERNIGFLPVCNGEGVAIGTLTDRDLVLRVLAEGRDPEATTAREIMSMGVVSCSADESLSDAEMLMSKHKVSRVVVVDERQHPVGIISLSDVAELETGRTASAVLRSVSQREART
ncbi:MAG TPA: CBS domain-containing protein [Polyangiaceae bacterium]